MPMSPRRQNCFQLRITVFIFVDTPLFNSLGQLTESAICTYLGPQDVCTWAYLHLNLDSPCEKPRVCFVPQQTVSFWKAGTRALTFGAPPPRSVSKCLTGIPMTLAKASFPASSSVEAKHRHTTPPTLQSLLVMTLHNCGQFLPRHPKV